MNDRVELETKGFMIKSADSYRSGLRSAVRGLWSGVLETGQFLDEMRTLINRRLSQAWDEGLAECDIKPDEMSEAEQLALGRAIQQELTFVADFAEAINANSKANNGKLGPLLGRADLWANRYEEIKNRAKAIACSDRKARWVVNPAKENCSSCSRLNGKIKRLSFWNDKGILPRVPGAGYLACRGFRCGCILDITTDPISKGPLPTLP